MKYKEETTDDLILHVFVLGGLMTPENNKTREKDLLKTFKELERRGVIKDGDELYKRTY